MTKKTETLERKDYSQKERDAMDNSDFGDPENQAFPIKTAQDVINAASRLHNASGDQDAIKARIKRIAKRKGFPLPQTWQDEDKNDEKERSMGADHTEALTRAVSADHEPMTTTHTHSHPAFGSQGDDDSHEHEHTHDGDNDHHHDHTERVQQATSPISMYMPIVRSATAENGDWIVEGQATSDVVDFYQTVFDFESAKKAFARWRGNVREQHDSKKAVGKGLEWWPDEENHCIYLRSRISKGAPLTWEKVLDGTLTGYSVSLDPRTVKTEVIERSGKRVKKYSDYDYLEVSLVDAPGSPGCDIQIVRADGMATDVLDLSEEEETPPAVVTPEPSVSSLDRAGARVSTETRGAMHEGIGHTLKAAVSQMKNCNCPDCQAAMKLIDPDGDNDIDMGGYSDPDQDWQSLYSGTMTGGAETDRMLAEIIERVLEAKLSAVYMRLQGIAGTIARVNAAPTGASLETLVTSAITRAVEAVQATNEASQSKVDADLSALKETVARIENTPVPGAPIMNTGSLPRPALNKQLPTDPIRDQYAPPKRSGSAVADAMRTLAEQGWLNTEQRQVDALAAGLLLQKTGGR